MVEIFEINEIVEVIQDDLRKLAIIVGINKNCLFDVYEVKRFNGIKYYDNGNCAILNYDDENTFVSKLSTYKVNHSIKKLYNKYRY